MAHSGVKYGKREKLDEGKLTHVDQFLTRFPSLQVARFGTRTFATSHGGVVFDQVLGERSRRPRRAVHEPVVLVGKVFETGEAPTES